MTTKLPEEVIKVHEKSLRLLDESKQQLKDVQEILRKSVVRLSIAARRDDDQLDDVLENIKSSVKNDMDLERLEIHLDKLLVHIDQTDRGQNADTRDNNDNVELFANKLSASLGLGFQVKQDFAVPEILDGLVAAIRQHVETLNSETTVFQQQVDSEPGIEISDIKEIISGCINSLILPETSQDERIAVSKLLDGSIEDADQWKEILGNIEVLINNSIKLLQVEKEELQVFIRKITAQLEEIEEYVRQSRQERINTVSESSILKDSVDANVDKIQSTVGDAEEIVQLKNDVQIHLKEIRKSVEEHNLAEIEREDMSKQGYAHIISELARTQNETLMLKEQLEESKKKMLRDPLTGLPNRLAYEERITLELNRCKRSKENICIAMWDIDHFKKVNDTFGHDAGDRVLKLLAKIITTRVRKVDMFARIGGEEFVLLMPDTIIENALSLNDQLRESLANSGFHYDGSPCPITASVGIAKIEEYDNSESVMRKADEALYSSKGNGRNRCTIFTNEDDL